MSGVSYLQYGPLSEGEGHHLAGVIDGEGYFGIARQTKATTGTTTYSCLFVVNMREDDGPLLERLRDLTGLGAVRYLGRWYGNRKPQVRWGVEKRHECAALVEILDQFPLWSKKVRDYEIWRRAVLYWNGPKPDGWAPMETWFREIRAGREYLGEFTETEVEISEPLF